MENIQFVTPLSVSQSELQEFVESLGGHWNSKVGLEQGSIEEGDAVIYLSLEGDVGAFSTGKNWKPKNPASPTPRITPSQGTNRRRLCV